MSVQLAHVSYVLSPEVQVESQGSDMDFLLSPLQEAANIGILAAAVLVIALCYLAEKRIGWVTEKIKFFRGRSRTYHEFIPLMLRVGVGLALIGAGSTGHLISPAASSSEWVGFVQILTGFLLVSGLLVAPATLCALVLYIAAIVGHPQLLGSLELPAAVLAFVLLGVSKPGFDDLLNIPSLALPEGFKKYVPLILRLGLGGALLAMSFYEKLLNPHLFAEVAERHLMQYVPLSASMWTLSVGLTELLVALALLLGLRTRFVSTITLAMLALSFFVFQEDVFAHVTLFATLASLILLGGGAYSIDSWYAHRKNAA